MANIVKRIQKYLCTSRNYYIYIFVIFLIVQTLLMVNVDYVENAFQRRNGTLAFDLPKKMTGRQTENSTTINTILHNMVPAQYSGYNSSTSTASIEPKCNITDKETLSAIKRANTEYCKQELARINCLQSENKLYPRYIPNLCPYQDKLTEKTATLYSNTTQAHNSETVKIAFVFILSGRQVRQILRLFNAVYSEDHFYYIHVDSRNDYLHRELLPLADRFSNVRMSSRRFATMWGGTQTLDAQLYFIKDLLEMKDWYWDYFINLSESHYPIKNLDLLVSFLTRYNGNNLKRTHLKNVGPNDSMKYGFLQCEDHMWKLARRDLPTGITYYKGGDWLGLHRTFCNYVVYGSDQLLKGLKQFFSYTLIPEEVLPFYQLGLVLTKFFQTLLRNSRFCNKLIEQDLTTVNWVNRKLGCARNHKQIVDWPGCSPMVIKTDYILKLKSVEQKPFFFSRKFDPVINQEIINIIDVKLFGRSRKDLLGFSYYWQNEYHHLDTNRIPSEAYLSHYLSFIRRTSLDLKLSYLNCIPYEELLLEANLLFKFDHFHGVLILYQAKLKGQHKFVTLETQYSMKSPLQLIKFHSNGPITRLANLEVGTDFDMKELIFRNYARFIGPLSTITVRHEWRLGPQLNVTVLFISPTLSIISSDNIELPKTSHIGYYEPQLPSPLTAGVWFIKILHNNTIVSTTKFLVLPTDTDNFNNSYRKQQNDKQDLMAKTKDLKINLMEVLKMNEPMETQIDPPNNNALQFEPWVDGLTSQFWDLWDTCVVEDITNSCSQLPFCSKVTWSSRSPDPKSKVKGINLFSN